MKIKRLVVAVLIMCMVVSIPVQAGDGKRIKKKGVYYINLIGAPKYGGKKLKKHYYKRGYDEYRDGLIVRIKLSGKKLKIWADPEYKKRLDTAKSHTKKKRLKYNKYYFKVSKNLYFMTSTFNEYTGEHKWIPMSKAKGIKAIKDAQKGKASGIVCASGRYYVRNGVLYRVDLP